MEDIVPYPFLNHRCSAPLQVPAPHRLGLRRRANAVAWLLACGMQASIRGAVLQTKGMQQVCHCQSVRR